MKLERMPAGIPLSGGGGLSTLRTRLRWKQTNYEWVNRRIDKLVHSCPVDKQQNTTAAVQRFLNDLAGESPSQPIVRDLLDRAAERLHILCASLLFRNYPRLTRPPLNLQSEEMLSAVVERLLKAMRDVRPQNVR